MSKFLSTQCACGEKHIVYGNATETLECACGKNVTEPTGGRAIINGKVLEVLS